MSIVSEYRTYRRLEPRKQRETETLLDRLCLDVAGQTILDLGPGTGTAMHVFGSRGASCRFVERHPVFWAECRRRGFHGKLGDFVKNTDLIEPADIIYVRGSITPANFTCDGSLTRWLDTLAGKTHILCPWLAGGHEPEWFSSQLDEQGFTRHVVDGYQDMPYPAVWVRYL